MQPVGPWHRSDVVFRVHDGQIAKDYGEQKQVKIYIHLCLEWDGMNVGTGIYFGEG